MTLGSSGRLDPVVSVDPRPYGRGRIIAALDRLTHDASFKASDRNKRFLRFVVEETLAGRADRIKAYTIAVDVFGRAPEFDPSKDPIVRIEAARLRGALTSYYEDPAHAAGLRIELPRGHYVPAFAESDGGDAEALKEQLPANAPSENVGAFRRAGIWIVVSAALAALSASLIFGAVN